MLPIIARARTLGLSMALATAGLGVVATVPASAATHSTWNINVGGEDFATFASLNRFYVSDITVHPGDVVNFNWRGFHTVTFNPLAGKSVLDYAFGGLTSSTTLDTPTTFVNGTPTGGGPGSPPPPPFRLTIGSTLPNGTYHFQCMLHQYMHGSIKVTRRELPTTDLQNQARGHAQMLADFARASSLNSRLISRGNENDGVALAGAGERNFDLINYYPTEVRVQAGEKVTFKMAGFGDPHSVTFGYAKSPLQPPGEIFASAPSPATYGGGDLNSGYLMSQSQFNYWHLAGVLPGFIRRSEYTIKFTTPGTYGFYCTLHGGILPNGTVVGMSGHVTVLPAEGGGGD